MVPNNGKTEVYIIERQRNWQLLRRGRYIEFNLLYDRSVKFGLANADPRVEGTMVSAPSLITWEYNHDINNSKWRGKINVNFKNANRSTG